AGRVILQLSVRDLESAGLCFHGSAQHVAFALVTCVVIACAEASGERPCTHRRASGKETPHIVDSAGILMAEGQVDGAGLVVKVCAEWPIFSRRGWQRGAVGIHRRG